MCRYQLQVQRLSHQSRSVSHSTATGLIKATYFVHKMLIKIEKKRLNEQKQEEKNLQEC